MLPLAVCGRNPCKYVLCVQGQQCQLDQEGVADCVCGTECRKEKKESIPVFVLSYRAVGTWGH